MQVSASAKVLDTEVTLTATVGDGVAVRADAMGRIMTVLQREAERFAQIAAVDRRDQIADRDEAKRIADAPADRSHVIAGAGSKEPDSVVVMRGAVHVNGRSLRATAPSKGAR